MSKQVNVKAVAMDKLEMISKYNVAYKAISANNSAKSEALAPLNEELKKIKADRVAAREGGMSIDEMVAKYPTSEVDAKIAAIEYKYSELNKPLRKDMANLRKLVSDDMYNAYKLVNLKGSVKATGKLNNDVKIEVSYFSQIQKLCENLGFKNVADDKAMTKLCNRLAIICGGMQKDMKGGYLKDKSKGTFKDIVCLAIIKVCVDSNKWIENADHTISIVPSAE